MRARVPFRLAIAAALACGLALAPTNAVAAEPAATAFDHGTTSFRLGHYAEAASAYERAASLSPHPLPLVNAAEAWERAGHLVQAANACERALALPVDRETRDGIEARLRRLLQQLGTFDITGPSQVAVRVDGAEPIHPPARLRVSPGRHRLELADESSNGTVVRESSVGAGEEQRIAVSVPRIDNVVLPAKAALTGEGPGATAPAPADPAKAGAPPVGTWIAFGIAGAAGLTTATFGALTVGAKGDYDTRPTLESADAFERNRLVTNVALVVTGAAALTGVFLWLTKPARPPARVGLHGGQVLLGGSF